MQPPAHMYIGEGGLIFFLKKVEMGRGWLEFFNFKGVWPKRVRPNFKGRGAGGGRKKHELHFHTLEL